MTRYTRHGIVRVSQGIADADLRRMSTTAQPSCRRACRTVPHVEYLALYHMAMFGTIPCCGSTPAFITDTSKPLHSYPKAGRNRVACVGPMVRASSKNRRPQRLQQVLDYLRSYDSSFLDFRSSLLHSILNNRRHVSPRTDNPHNFR
jgi:hypothetical protein